MTPRQGSVLVFNHDVLHAGLQVRSGAHKYIARTEYVFRCVDRRRGIPSDPEKEQRALGMHKESAELEGAGDVEGSTALYLEALALQAEASSLAGASTEGLSALERLPAQVLLGDAEGGKGILTRLDPQQLAAGPMAASWAMRRHA